MIDENDPELQDVKEGNNAQRVKARLEHKRRMNAGVRKLHAVRMEEGARGSGRPNGRGGTTAPRSLPSGPAPNPTGFALSLLILGFVALILGFGAIAWICWSVFDSIFGQKEGQDG